MYHALVSMSHPRLFFVCFPFAASCKNQPFSHHDQSLTPQAATSAVTQPIRSLVTVTSKSIVEHPWTRVPRLSYTIPITYGLGANPSLETDHGLYFITPDTLSV